MKFVDQVLEEYLGDSLFIFSKFAGFKINSFIGTFKGFWPQFHKTHFRITFNLTWNVHLYSFQNHLSKFGNSITNLSLNIILKTWTLVEPLIEYLFLVLQDLGRGESNIDFCTHCVIMDLGGYWGGLSLMMFWNSKLHELPITSLRSI